MLRFGGICLLMGRPLFAMLIAAVMLFAPLALRGGSAMAMVPAADHHAQMMDRGHCDDQPVEDKDSQSADQSCCVAMCTAIAIDAARATGPHDFHGPTGPPAPSQFRHDFLAKLPTPPPRLA